MFPYLKAQSLVGLDIQANEVRLLHLKQHRKSLRIENFAIAQLPLGAMKEEAIHDRQAVSQTIKHLVSETHTHGSAAVIALPGNSIIKRRIKLPGYLSAEECEEELTTRLDHYLTGMDAQLCFDFVRLGANDGEHQDVLLVAARQDQLQDYVETVNQSGLVTKVVDADVFALARVAQHCVANEVERKSALAILDVNLTTAQFIVTQDNEIIFSHHLLTQELIAQVKYALQLCLSSHRNVTITSLFLTGNYSCFDEIAHVLTHECKIASAAANPFASVKKAEGLDALSTNAARMSLCFGLAMRSIPQW